jgi:hypothetical protein
MVTGADLLAALKKASIRPVSVAGVDVHVRGVTGAERKLIIERARAGTPLQANELCALCLCDDRGAALFTAEQAADLDQADGGCLERLGTEILSASGLLPQAEAEAAKN